MSKALAPTHASEEAIEAQFLEPTRASVEAIEAQVLEPTRASVAVERRNSPPKF